MTQTPAEAFQEAINKAGGMPKLGRALVSDAHPNGVTKAAIFDILKRLRTGKDHGINSDYAMIIEELTGVPCELLNPGAKWHVLTRRKKTQTKK